MSKLPPLVRFKGSDFPDAPPWFQTFLAKINQFNEQLYSTVSSGVSFDDNIASQTYNGTNKTEDFPINISKTLKEPVKSGWITKCVATDGTAITNGTHLDWNNESDGTITFTITGLTATKEYEYTVIFA